MRIKAGVDLRLLRPQMTIACINVQSIWSTHGLEPTITSGSDGKHREDSLHYSGFALDFRTRDLSSTKAMFFRDRLREALGEDFDVVLEANPPHLHVEFDPK